MYKILKFARKEFIGYKFLFLNLQTYIIKMYMGGTGGMS